ncbi:MAG: T9SS type A sorting domain-containing protein [Planctomycetia bacterium]|nr:T9SS type A sorting domain-containing protein [Planctomycetia bacterium]
MKPLTIFFQRKKQTVILSVILLLTFHLQSFGQTTTGAFKKYSTIKSIGFEWNISGDTNNNAQCLVQYRINGSTNWLDAQPLFRVNFESYDMLAGSILFLYENTEYEVKLDFSDPDGGSEIRTELISTKPVPLLPVGGNTYHVIPGTTGGDGSQANPFQGIVAAQNAAQAGDIFLLHTGDYGTNGQVYFTQSGTENNHIVWKAAGDGDVIFNQVRIEANYIWLEGLNFIYDNTNNAYGIRTSPPGPMGIVIKYNYFFNCHYCIYLNDGGENWYITDNTIIGDNDPNNGSNFSGEGIELWYTSGHTVAYNSISRVADGISYPRSNVDIYGNEIFDTTDDGIEGDYGHNNIRIWGNRISNPLNNGISFQPMNGAPWYVLYNQVAAPGQDALKLRDRTDRVLLAHNTLVAWSGPVSSGSQFMRSFQSNNNLWISVQDRYIWEDSYAGGINWRTNWDYDGYDWGAYPYAFKWEGQRLVDIPEFQNYTGQAMNAIQVDKNTCFETFNIPNPPPASMPFQFMTLNSNCNAIDAGITLANINDGYLGNAPDLGVYEYGKELPHYGPRENASLSDNDETLNSTISIYPNPTSNTFIIDVNNDVLKNVIIYNYLGQLIKETTSSKIDISNIANGIYFVKIVTQNDKITIKKMIKN